MTMKLAMLGFGNVGQGIARILVEEKQLLKDKYGFDFQVTGVYDKLKGGVLAPGGVDLEKLLALAADGKSLSGYPGGSDELTSEQIIDESEADVLLEMTYTDLETGQPAIDFVKRALKRGMSVTTSNKGPAVLALDELNGLAAENNARFMIEGSVMSGTPVINLATKNLAGAAITGFKGILNGTTNFILTRMEEGLAYDAALAEAQEKGYAEADPTNDVEGFDAGAKGVILANLLMNAGIKLSEIPKQGISHLTPEIIKEAAAENCRYKVLVECSTDNGKAEVKVGPVKLPMSDPLSAIGGATNAITFDTNMLGPVTIIGAGAGRVETGFALLADILELHRELKGGE